MDNVSTSANNSGLDVDDDSTVTSLSVAHITPVSIANTKTLSGAITVTAGSIKLAETGTLASSISMTGGVLDADNSLTVSGALTLGNNNNITIDVLTDKTLTYTRYLSVNTNTLTLSGGGTFSNTNYLRLNTGGGILSLAGILTIGKVATTASSPGKGIQVLSSATIGDLRSESHESNLAIAANQTLDGELTITAKPRSSIYW